jgi:hypothetical protein
VGSSAALAAPLLATPPGQPLQMIAAAACHPLPASCLRSSARNKHCAHTQLPVVAAWLARPNRCALCPRCMPSQLGRHMLAQRLLVEGPAGPAMGASLAAICNLQWHVPVARLPAAVHPQPSKGGARPGDGGMGGGGEGGRGACRRRRCSWRCMG